MSRSRGGTHLSTRGRNRANQARKNVWKKRFETDWPLGTLYSPIGVPRRARSCHANRELLKSRVRSSLPQVKCWPLFPIELRSGSGQRWCREWDVGIERGAGFLDFASLSAG